MSAIFISHSSEDNAAAETMRSWLRECGHTSYFLDFDRESGIRAGTNWEQELYQALRRCHAVIALITPNWLESKWCFAETIQAREKGKPIFFVTVESCTLPSFLRDSQGIDLTIDPESGYLRLALGLKEQGLDPNDIFIRDPERKPYPGLAAFQEEDAAVFFGRSSEIFALRETLDRLHHYDRDVPRLLLVLGASGSGKSSLVRAGVIPRLRKDQANWLPLRPFRPQDERDPIDALAFAIADTCKSLDQPFDREIIRARLKTSSLSPTAGGEELSAMAREITAASRHRQATILITVDQAEELFRSGAPKTATSFLQLLGSCLSAGDRHVMVIATLRSDFLGIFQNFVATQDTRWRLGFNHLPFTVEPVPLERYAELVQGPARQVRLDLEEELVMALIQDAGQRDSLSLLAFTLRRLYDLHLESAQGPRLRKLTLYEYNQLGRLGGAVRNAAEQIVGELKPTSDELNDLREAFIPGLVRSSDDNSFSRRRAFLDELPKGALRLIGELVDARLLIASSAEDGEAVDRTFRPTIEIAHEALLRTWPRLGGWLIEDRDRLRLDNAIRRAAREWEEHGRTDDLLVHREGRLKDAVDLASQRRFTFPVGSVEEIYLKACEANQRASEEAARIVRERQLEDAQKFAQLEAERAGEAEKRAKEQIEAASKLRNYALAAGGAAIATLFLLSVSLLMWRESQKQAQVADVQRLSAESSAVLERYPQRSLLLAVEALRKGQLGDKAGLPKAQESLMNAVHVVGGRAIAKNNMPPIAMASSLDGRWFVLSGGDGVASVLDLTTKEPSANSIALRGHDKAIRSMAISADSRWLVTGAEDHTARVWDLKAKDPAAKSVELRGHQGPVTVAAISSDGQWIVTAAEDDTLRLWDFTVKDRPPTSVVLCGHKGGVIYAAISADDRWVVTSGDDGTARLWDLRAKEPAGASVQLPSIKVSRYPDTVSLGPQSHWLFTKWGEAGEASLWDLTAKDPTANPVVFHGREDGIREVSVIRGSNWLFIQMEDHTARLLDLGAENPAVHPVVLSGVEGYMRSVVISSDGHWLAASPGSGNIRLWNLGAKEPTSNPIVLRGVIQSHDVDVLAISPDNHWLVISGQGLEDNTLQLLDLTAQDPIDAPIVLRGHDWRVLFAVISPDCHWLLTVADDYSMRLWNLRAKDLVSGPPVLPGQEGFVSTRISQDSHWLITASNENAELWDLTVQDPAAESKVLSGHKAAIVAMAVSPDNHWIVTGSQDRTARIWDLRADDPMAKPVVLPGHDWSVTTVVISPDSRWLVTGSDQKYVLLSDLRADQVARSVPLGGHKQSVNAVVISSDSRWLVTGSRDQVQLWDLKAEHPDAKPVLLPSYGTAIDVVGIGADSHWLVTRSEGDNVWLWDLRAKDAVAKPTALRVSSDAIQFVNITPDNHWLVTGLKHGAVWLWNLMAEDPVAKPFPLLGADRERTDHFVSSSDNHWFAASTEDSVQLWDLRAIDFASEPIVLRVGAYIRSMEITSDNLWLVTDSDDHNVRLWDLASQDPATGFVTLHGGYPNISPDSHWLVTGSRDRTPRLWLLQGNDLINLARLLAGRNLRAEESTLYFPNDPYHRTFSDFPGPVKLKMIISAP